MPKSGKPEARMRQIRNWSIQASWSAHTLYKASMESRHTTVIVEPRLLFRDGLRAIMGNSAYHIVSEFMSAAEISGASTMSDKPALVILGGPFAHSAFTEAAAIRKLLPKAKIALLYEADSPPDYQKLRGSIIDGCVPSSESLDTLVNALDIIMAGDVRTMVLPKVRSSN
jgi:DNA-binding NarL/FixJ family response regulator